MMTAGLPFAGLGEALAGHGLLIRGGVNFAHGEVAPPGPSGAPARSVILIGNAGPAMWPHFAKWLAGQAPADPLDTWSKQVIDAAAEAAQARAVYPNDRPYLPFQRWAMQAEGLTPSPLGILMHPGFGLWHAYRGALLFDDEILIQALQEVNHLCDACTQKPCLSTCPVNAYSASGFDAPTCVAHLAGPDLEPRAHSGCSARNACPHGAAYRYGPAQQAFHQRAFVGARLPD